MTLLLNVIGPTGIHMSSDYRLTDIGTKQPIEDALGSKQLECSSDEWTAYVAFTGIAQINGQKTRDWILETLRHTSRSAGIQEAIANLVSRATNEVQCVPSDIRRLTMVVTVNQAGQRPRFHIISCIDRPNGPPLTNALSQFAAYEILSDKPGIFIFGFVDAVSSADRKFLKDLAESQRSPAAIRAALAQVNVRSARKSRGWISEACMVSSVLVDNTVAWENFGQTPGAPPGIGDIAQALHTLQPGTRPVIMQGGARREKNFSSMSLPINVSSEGSTILMRIKNKERREPLFVTGDQGQTITQMPSAHRSDPDELDAEWQGSHAIEPNAERRTISISSPTVATSLTDDKGLEIGVITVGGITGTAILGKGELGKAPLHTLTVQLNPSAAFPGRPRSALLQIANVPTIDGVKPRSWTYSIDLTIDDEAYLFSVRRNSIAFRSTNYASPMQVLADSEELKMSAPREHIALRLTRNSPIAFAVIQARFLLGDYRDSTAPMRKDLPQPGGAKVGRNSPCPCGNGKKYKKCCGRAL